MMIYMGNYFKKIYWQMHANILCENIQYCD